MSTVPYIKAPSVSRSLAAVFVLLFAGRAYPLLAQAPRQAAAASFSFGKAEPMPDLNVQFEPHEGWIGGDGAYSVAMSPRQTLWLFSDTWIGSVRDGKRTNATIVNNTLGLQDGRGKDAKVQFVVRRDDGGKPAAFITPADKRGWFWLQAGAVSGDRLYLFLSQIEKSESPGVFGFRQIGRWLGSCRKPARSALEWRITQRKLPCTIIARSANWRLGRRSSAMASTFTSMEPTKTKGRHRAAVILSVARVPIAAIGDFTAWRYYHDGQWAGDFHNATRMVRGMASELSVSYLPEFKRYVLVYTEGGLSPRILARTAAAPWGPWSAATTLYECPESHWDKKDLLLCGEGPSVAGIGRRTGDQLRRQLLRLLAGRRRRTALLAAVHPRSACATSDGEGRAMTSYIQVVTTTARRDEADRIARELVEKRLAACVQIVGPITSTYRWQGKIETDKEWQICCKTRGELFAQVEAAIRSLHPYDVPEILAVPIAAGSERYLAWLDEQTRAEQ